MKHIRKSFEKFKSELLSKGFYDIFKAILIFLGGLLSTYLFSLLPGIKNFLITELSIPYYFLIILILIFFCLLYLIFRYKSKLDDIITINKIDDLTGLKNHKALEEKLNQLIKDFKENTSFIIIDIDNFKSFNSEFSYQVADMLLKSIGELLGNDKRVTDETFRYFHRGDEFIIVANETNLSQAIQAAERKRKLIHKNIFEVNNVNHQLTVSCGVTTLKKDDNIDSLKERLSKALSEAKKIPGKNNTKSIS